MSFAVQLTALLASGTEVVQDRLLGYPLRGTPVTGGIHGPIPETWDGNGAVPPGWSSYRGSSRKHPTLSQWATPVDPDATAAMANGRRARLTAQEQTKMAADLAAATDLTADWFPAQLPVGVDDSKGGRT